VLSADILSANGCTRSDGIERATTSCGTTVVVVAVVEVVVGRTVVVDELVEVVVGKTVVVVLVVVVVVVVVVVTGVIAESASAVAPVLTMLRALIRNEYDVSFTRPVTVALSDIDTPSSNNDHTPEPCTEYSTT
jgi:Na+(H+)/acetate symporter ActP